MLEALRHGYGNYFNFNGYTERSTYWWWVLANILILVILSFADIFFVNPALNLGYDDNSRPLSMVYSIIILIPNIPIGVRRLHDSARSGWWILIGLVPIIGTLGLIYFFVQPGKQRPL